MKAPSDAGRDDVHDAMIHGEAAPVEFSSWNTAMCLRRLRLRFGLTRRDLAARAGVSGSLVGRAEKGADVRIGTLRRLYGAMGCRLLLLPAGASYELDWRDAHRDNEWLDEGAEADRIQELWRRRRRALNNNANSPIAREAD